MVHVLVRHKVADYNRWKQAFDSHLNTRKHAGETGCRIFHTVDDPKEVVLFLDWDAIETARKFMKSDESAEGDAASWRRRCSRGAVHRGCPFGASFVGRLVCDTACS